MYKINYLLKTLIIFLLSMTSLILKSRYHIEFFIDNSLVWFLFSTFIFIIVILVYLIEKKTSDYTKLNFYLIILIFLIFNYRFLYMIIEEVCEWTLVYKNNYFEITKIWHIDELQTFANNLSKNYNIEFKEEFLENARTPEQIQKNILQAKLYSISNPPVENFGIYDTITNFIEYLKSFFF